MNINTQKVKLGVFIILLSFVLGLIDWSTGYELNFFVFYFLPVSLAAWFLGTASSVFLAVLCSMLWFGADVLTGHSYSSSLYGVWNTLIRLASFLAIGLAVAKLHRALINEKEKTSQLQASLSEIKVLKAFLPICSQCKKIRDDNGNWQPLESYISKHADTRFSHGYCPECYKKALDEAGILDP